MLTGQISLKQKSQIRSIVKELTQIGSTLCGPLSSWYGASSGCEWGRRPPDEDEMDGVSGTT